MHSTEDERFDGLLGKSLGPPETSLEFYSVVSRPMSQSSSSLVLSSRRRLHCDRSRCGVLFNRFWFRIFFPLVLLLVLLLLLLLLQFRFSFLFLLVSFAFFLCAPSFTVVRPRVSESARTDARIDKTSSSPLPPPPTLIWSRPTLPQE